MWSFQVGLGTALHSSRLQVLVTSSLCPSNLILRTSPLGCGVRCHDLEKISKKPLALEKASMGVEWGGESDGLVGLQGLLLPPPGNHL